MSAGGDLAFLELTEVAELVRGRQVSSVELTEAILERIDACDDQLRSYATVTGDAALEAARTADADIALGRYRGPLHGIPVAVKDLCHTADTPTAAGGTIFADFVPPCDATVVRRLKAAGAVITGKLRMTEGAYAEHHPSLPSPVNPWDADTWTGSSSSGSGVATAAGLCYASLGSDTGGSIRLPSAQNGVTGIKPTWGRVSRYGVFELAESLDHIGPMTRSARDAGVVLSAIAGEDPHDPTAAPVPVPDYAGYLRLDHAPSVGIDWDLTATFDEPTQAMLTEVVRIVESLGWRVYPIELPDFPSISAEWESMCAVETAAAHSATYPSRASEYGPALAHLIDIGLGLSAVDYQALLSRRRAFTGRLKRVFHDVDLVLLPGAGLASPTTETMASLGTSPELLAGLLVPTAPLDISGTPTITLPGGVTERGTPIGFQLCGSDFSEQLLVRAAHAFQSVTDYHKKHPVLEKATVPA
ncbi:amidase [Dietzia sp. PP-33]|jgi:amidase|uniref:amidase n=1 Tax=Dietzia sp. PP-33 TaxID=2957500 RepID=UPI0029ABF77C|nr:amidase [Dietzia sp. PP-33]MDX2357781.1 amidase [Dietzia sp. PP-33]